MARPSQYEELVKPHIEKVKEWAASGATNKEIAEALGIGLSTLQTYKTKYKEFQEAFARGRVAVCCDIKAALLKKALGFSYQEEKKVARKDKSGENIVVVERYDRYVPPSETAAAMLLRNYDETWRDSDDISIKFKQQEQELKKKIAESNNWFDE